MTTPNNDDTINFCIECELEYPGQQSAPCPLCPYWEKVKVANVEVHRVEPYTLLTASHDWRIERLLNDATADGWTLDTFRVCHRESTLSDEGMPEGGTSYAVLLRRKDYDQDRHRETVDARQKARDEHSAKRREVESEVAELKAVRAEEV